MTLRQVGLTKLNEAKIATCFGKICVLAKWMNLICQQWKLSHHTLVVRRYEIRTQLYCNAVLTAYLRERRPHADHCYYCTIL